MKIRIIFFGDSICFGQGISIHNGWITMISSSLERLAEKLGLDITVINAGVNGNTTRLALERMPYDVQTHHPDILLVQFGMNDCNYWASDLSLPRVSPNAFIENLREIFLRGAVFGASKIFINTNHPSTRNIDHFPGLEITYQDSNSYYNSLIRELSMQSNKEIELNDVELTFNELIKSNKLDLQDALFDDGIHLSKIGHQLYYELIYPKIEKAVYDLVNKQVKPQNND
jgi:acyl-CoA thioesterase I